MIDENKRMQGKRTKRTTSSLRERGSKKGANFWKMGVTNVAPTKNVLFFSLSDEVH